MSEDWRAEVDAWGLLVVPSDALRGMLDGGVGGLRRRDRFDSGVAPRSRLHNHLRGAAPGVPTPEGSR